MLASLVFSPTGLNRGILRANESSQRASLMKFLALRLLSLSDSMTPQDRWQANHGPVGDRQGSFMTAVVARQIDLISG